ncbi:MAG: HAD family hydrolase [Dehalococcoidia bacterium]|jgi:HAD superfamily hydrolase (TIGR01549 family)|nr:MAG: putative hydrolase of the HAD superfamily [Chloroflexota bacterium]|tara:strand:+ start:6014 stop:6742 length:729 start_codon:yes stop_codon:yes gene_type:complete
MNYNIEGITLDLDDTLVDSRSAWKNGFKKTFSDLICLNKQTTSQFNLDTIYIEYTQIVSTSHETAKSSEWSEDIAKISYKEISKKYLNIEININEIWNNFEKEWQASIDLFPESLEIIKNLSTKYKLGMITNGLSAHQRFKIEKFSLEKFFNCILISEEFGNQKPDKSIFNKATELMKIKPQEIIHIGDNPAHDVIGANNSEIISCWIKRKNNWYKENINIRPDYTIKNLKEIIQIIDLHND